MFGLSVSLAVFYMAELAGKKITFAVMDVTGLKREVQGCIPATTS